MTNWKGRKWNPSGLFESTTLRTEGLDDIVRILARTLCFSLHPEQAENPAPQCSMRETLLPRQFQSQGKIKPQLSLCLIKHHAMNKYGGVEV